MERKGNPDWAHRICGRNRNGEPMVEIRTATGAGDREAAFDVRLDVFVEEQGIDPELELDEHDETATHLVAWSGDEPVGAARLRSYRPEEGAEPVAKFERIAVLAEYRGRGIGRRLLDALEARARDAGFDRARLHAQTRSAGFYESAGYERVGEPFEEAGIPHVAMVKSL